MNTEILGYNDSPTKKFKREVILKSAFILFNEKSITRTTINEISDYAEVTRQTFYNYYKNKNEITEDLQILTFEELDWFNILITTESDNFNKHFKNLTKTLLIDKIDYFRYLNNFDLKFTQSYYSSKYTSYLERELAKCRIKLDKLENFERLLHIFLGYCQRVVIRVHYNTSCPKEYLEELYNFIDLITKE